jgi:hypothetical protein
VLGKSRPVVGVLGLALSVSLLLIIPSFNAKVFGIGPAPVIPWEFSEPFSPTGFFYVDKTDKFEYRLLNGTSASFSFKVMPSSWPPALEEIKFPLNLTLDVAVRDKILGTMPEDVSIALSRNTVSLRSSNDSAILSVTLSAEKDVKEATYQVSIKRTLDNGGTQGGKLPLEINVLTGYQSTTIITQTTTSTIITTTSTLTEVEPSIYTWAVGATVAAVVLAIVLMLQRRTRRVGLASIR